MLNFLGSDEGSFWFIIWVTLFWTAACIAWILWASAAKGHLKTAGDFLACVITGIVVPAVILIAGIIVANVLELPFQTCEVINQRTGEYFCDTEYTVAQILAVITLGIQGVVVLIALFLVAVAIFGPKRPKPQIVA